MVALFVLLWLPLNVSRWVLTDLWWVEWEQHMNTRNPITEQDMCLEWWLSTQVLTGDMIPSMLQIVTQAKTATLKGYKLVTSQRNNLTTSRPSLGQCKHNKILNENDSHKANIDEHQSWQWTFKITHPQKQVYSFRSFFLSFWHQHNKFYYHCAKSFSF